MSFVLGYLRFYVRWDGTPGLSLAKQKSLVRRTAREFHPGWKQFKYVTELPGAEALKWPALREVIRRAKEDGQDRGILVVIPTLDGVQFNLSFLGLLADPECDHTPICVRSGWRRVGVIGRDTNYKERANHKFWRLVYGEEWLAFSEMVARVRRRGRAIKASLRRAADRGDLLGARCRGAHRFTAAERRRGGCTTAAKRRRAANEPYQKWIQDIWCWQARGLSIRQITGQLAHRNARTPDGRKIGPMLVCRILKRAGRNPFARR